MVGDFTRAGDVLSPGAAAYDTRTGEFVALGRGLDGEVNAIEIAPDGTVYVGGRFQIRFRDGVPDIEFPYYPSGTYLGDNPTMMLAKLVEGQWTPIGTRDWTLPISGWSGSAFQPAAITDIAVSTAGRIAVHVGTWDHQGHRGRVLWTWNGESWARGRSSGYFGPAHSIDDTLFYTDASTLVTHESPYAPDGTAMYVLADGVSKDSYIKFVDVYSSSFAASDVGRWTYRSHLAADRIGNHVYALMYLSGGGEHALGVWRFNLAGGSPVQIASSVPLGDLGWHWEASYGKLEFTANDLGIVASIGTEAIVFTRPELLSNPSGAMLTGTLLTGVDAGWKRGIIGPGGTLFLTQATRSTNDGDATGVFRRSSSGNDTMLEAIDDRDGLSSGAISIREGVKHGDPITVIVRSPDDADLYDLIIVAREGPTRVTRPADGVDYSSSLKIGEDTILPIIGGPGLGRSYTYSVTKSVATSHSYTFDAYGVDAFGHYTLVASINYRAVQPVVMFVPNFLGSLPRFNLTNPTIAAAQADEFVNTLGFDPVRLYPEQIDKSANKLLEVFDGVPGYRLGENLIFAAYDWRLPVAPAGVADAHIDLDDLNFTDNVYAYAVEYLVYWLERAKDGFRAQYGDLNGFRIHLVTHGTGGIVTRAFLQSVLYEDEYMDIIKKVVNIGTPHEGFVDAFFHRDSTVGEMLDGIEPRADADSQKYVQVLREAAARNGMTDTPVPTWVPGIVDYMPTFEFIKRGPDGYPPPAGTYDNRFLKDLNALGDSYNWRVPGGILNVSSTGVDTPYQVYYSFGTRETRYNDLGDGLVLRSSAEGSEYGQSYVWDPYEWDLPVGFDQRDLINDDRMIAMYREYAALDPVGLVNEQTASLGTHLRRTATGFEFSVVYLHIDDLEIPSFGSNDLTVTGPLGGTLPISLVKISDASVFGPIRTVYYSVTLPTGAWRPQDAGLYNIRLRENAVRTYQGVPLDARNLGSIDSREISDTLLGSRAELDADTGMPVVYARSALSGWRLFNIAGIAIGTDRQTAPGTGIQSWQDPKDGLFYVAVSTSDGLYLYQQKSASEWFVRNLTNEISGSQRIARSLTHFITRDANRRITIAGLAADGDLVVYQQTGAISRGDYVYKFHDVADEYLRPIGKAMPVFVGPLVSYVTPWNGQNIAGLNASGKIEVIWNTTKTKGYWVHSNLSAITGAPAFNGGLTVYQTSWKGINIVGVNAEGNVVTTWWVPRFAGKWATSNLSAIVSGPNLQGVSLVAFQTPNGGLNIAGIRPNGHTSLYWWQPNTDNKWKVRQLTKSSSSEAQRPTGSLAAQVLTDGSVNLFGRNPGLDVVRVYWQPGLLADDWRLENLSEIAV